MLVILGVLGGLYALRGIRREAQFEAIKREGLQQLADGDPETALGTLGRIVNRTPPDPQVLRAFAEAREAVPSADGRHLLAAIQAWQRLSDLDPDDRDLRRRLLRLYARAGFASEADQQAERLLTDDPDDAEALRVRLEIASIRGRTDEARRFATRLLARPDATFDELRARALVEFRESRDPAELLRQIRRWSLPASLEAGRRAVIADLMLRSGDPEEALAEAESALQLQPEDPGTIAVLAELLDRFGRGADVNRMIERAILRSPRRDEVAEVAIGRLWRANRLEAARTELDKAEGAFGREDPRWLRWRLRLAAMGSEDPLAPMAARTLRDLPGLDLAEARLARIWATALEAAIDETLPNARRREALRPAIEAMPQDPLLRYLRGRLRLEEGDPLGAIDDLRFAFEREGRAWIGAGLPLLVAQELSGAPAEAVRTASELLGRYADQLPVVIAFASTWANLEAQERPIESLDLPTRPTIPLDAFLIETLDRSGGDPRVAVLLADLGARRGDRALAERGLAVAMGALRLPPGVLVRFAEAALAVDSEHAEVLVERVAAQAPELPAGARLRAQRRARAGDPAGAFAELRAALDGEALRELDPAIRSGILAAFAAQHGLPEAETLLAERRRRLETAEGPDAARQLLALPGTWQDEAVASAAIGRLSSALGANHPEVAKAEARWVLAFRADEPLRRDASVAAMTAFLERGAEDREAALLLVQLVASSPNPNLPLLERSLRRLIELAPENLGPYPDLARTLLQSGRPDLAADIARAYLERSRGDAIRTRDAIALLQQAGAGGDALSAARELAGASDDDQDWLLVARLLAEDGRTAESGRILLARAARPEVDLALLFDAVDWEIREGRVENAWQRVTSRAANDPTLDLPVVAVRFWMAAADRERADAAAAALAESGRSDPVAIATRADWLEARGRLDEAIDLVRARLSADLDSPEMLPLLRWAAQRPAHPRWEIDGSSAVRDRIASLAPVVLELAELLRDSTNAAGALQPSPSQLERALALVESRPRDDRVWSTAIRMHLAAGRGEQALDLASRATVALPRIDDLQFLRAQTLLALGRAAEARAALQPLRERDRVARIEIDLAEAEAELGLGNPAAAIALLEPHRAAGGVRLERSRGLLAAANLMAGRGDAAIALLEGRPQALALLSLDLLPRLDAATSAQVIAAIEPQLAQDPGLVLTVSGRLLQQHERSGERRSLDLAAALLDRADLPASPQRQLLRGDLAGARVERERAIEFYRSVIDGFSAARRQRLSEWARLAPDEQQALAVDRTMLASALNNMAYHLARLGQPGQAGLDAIEEALVLLPGVPALRDTKASVLIRLRRFPAARAEAEAAVLASPDEAAYRKTFADALWGAGAIPEARREVAVGLELLNREPGTYPRLRLELEQLSRALATAQPGDRRFIEER